MLVTSPAAQRWADLVVRFCSSPVDARNLTQLGRVLGLSRGALRGWCQSASVSASSTLDLARVLRAVVLSRTSGLPVRDLLDVVDYRTLERLARRGSLDFFRNPNAVPSARTVLMSQTFVRRQVLLVTLDIRLAQFLAEAGLDSEACTVPSLHAPVASQK